MTIKNNSEIQRAISILESRDAKLYHACQLQDLRSYISLGGIPSRNKLSQSGLAFTAFDTDSTDKQHSLWDKVFGNFSDFGSHFTKENSNSTPNPYGPIQIVLNPSALKTATDLSITLRSVGSKNFERERESLNNPDDLNKIFHHINPIDARNSSEKKYIAFSKELNNRFARADCTSPEFNCSIGNELFSFDHAIYFIVDTCIYQHTSLLDEVQKIAPKRAIARTYHHENKRLIIEELSRLSATYECTKNDLINGSFASDRLKSWVEQRNEFYYNRFIRYLQAGTTRA